MYFLIDFDVFLFPILTPDPTILYNPIRVHTHDPTILYKLILYVYKRAIERRLCSPQGSQEPELCPAGQLCVCVWGGSPPPPLPPLLSRSFFMYIARISCVHLLDDKQTPQCWYQQLSVSELAHDSYFQAARVKAGRSAAHVCLLCQSHPIRDESY